VQRWNLPAGWVISTRPAHPALVSEADYIAAQEASAPRGPAGPAARRYLLAGLLCCGTCGRRLESAWSNGRPAYRCRHGYSSATRPARTGRRTYTSARTRSCPAWPPWPSCTPQTAIRVAGRTGRAHITAPAQTADLIDRLRAAGVSLSYDPATKALRTETKDAVALGVG
jgi:site-specific DNA recombinase